MISPVIVIPLGVIVFLFATVVAMMPDGSSAQSEGSGVASALPVSDVWLPADAGLTSGLVTVQTSPTDATNGIVMTPGGLVATSYGLASRATHLTVTVDGGQAMPATIAGFDAAKDVAVLRVPGFNPSGVARMGTAVSTGDTLTLLDDRGDGLQPLGLDVHVWKTDQYCVRMGAETISGGFWFNTVDPIAESGAAVVRDDGTVVGMFYGGDKGATRCAVPIASVQRVIMAVETGKSAGTVHVGPAGSLGIGAFNAGDYPVVANLDPTGPAYKAGIRDGDELTRIGTTSLHSLGLADLSPASVVAMLTPGTKVTLEWQHAGGAVKSATVTVAG